MWFRVLGPVAVEGPDGAADLVGRQARALLSLLAIRWPHEARREWLEDQIWHGARTSESALRVLVLRVRRSLAEVGLDGVIRTTQQGYVIQFDGDDATRALDLRRFDALIDAGVQARARRDERAGRSLLDEANAMWLGDPFEGASECEAFEPHRARLLARRVEVVGHLASSMVALGDHDGALSLLGPIIDLHPDREHLTAVAMVAAVRAGRPADALRWAARLRDRLRIEVGVDPGAEVIALERQILDRPGVVTTGEQVLRSGLVASAAAARVPLPARLQYLAAGPIVGREAELALAMHVVGRATGQVLGRIVGQASEGGDDAGPATVLCITGLPGIGKTRMLAEVAANAHRAGSEVVYLACLRSGGDGHEPVAELVRHLLAMEPESVGSELDELASEPVTGGSAELVAQAVARRARLLTIVQRILDARSRPPLLLVVDDVQWVGSASGEFLGELVRSSGPRVTWAFGLRALSDLVEAPSAAALVGGPNVARIDLGQLDAADIARITEGVLGTGVPGDRRATVVERAQGNPLFALELAQYVKRGGDPAAAPPDVQRTVRMSLEQLGAEALRAARLAALARPGYPVGVLLRLMADSDVAAGAVDALQRVGILEPITDGLLHFRHPLVAQAVAEEIGPAVRSRMHLELAAAVPDDDASSVVAAEHYLDAGSLAADDEVDRAVARSLGRLMLSGAFGAAAPFARRWVASVAHRPSRSVARVQADIAAATALIAIGETAEALPLLDTAERLAAALDIPELLTDAHLARGPLGVRALPATAIDELIALDGRLAPGDVTRRIQLLCWAAHHLMVSGDDGRAAAIVESASRLGVGTRGVVMDTVLLGMRYQLAAGVMSTPERAATAYAEVEELESESRFVTLSSMTHLFGLTQTLRAGDRIGFRRRLDLLREQLPLMPRPDLKWWTDAADACLAIADGGPAALAAIDRAAATATALQVSHGFPVAALHHVLVRYDAGTLGEMLELLIPRRDDTSPTQRMMYAAACADAGDIDTLRSFLEAGPVVALGATGEQWPAVAALACEATFHARDVRWASTLRAALEPHSGTALSLHGLAYLGAVDVHLARMAAVEGDLVAASDLFERGLAFDDRFGAVSMVARARRDAAAVGATIDW